MKKNLFSLIILALVVVNLALTAIMTIMILPETQKANELISKVCAAIDLDLEGGNATYVSNSISMEDAVLYTIEETMTINLKDNGDGEEHIAVVAVSIVMDSTNKDYKTYGGDAMTEKEAMIKDKINEVISGFTVDEMRDEQSEVKEAIVEGLQGLYGGSRFITGVNFSDVTIQ